ncbi:MAG: peptidylprolyl isomerase [Acidobacteria bacterium]|nr:peptidylprolyl isomerase [Acidobacteriota bacterium]
MLDLMRRKKQLKAILWLVIVGLALGMLLLFIPGTNVGGGVLATSAATVDGDPIPMQEYWKTYRRILDTYSAGGRNRLDPETIKALGLGRQALDSLINSRVTEYAAKRLGLSVSQDELRRAIETHPSLRDGNAFIGVERYKALLAANNLSVTEFEKGLYNMLLSRKLQNMIADSIDVSDRELRAEFSRENQEAQVEYVVLRRDDFSKKVKPTESELRAWFESNKEKYVIKEQRSAQYLLLSVESIASTITVTEQDVRDVWDRQSHEETVEASHILFKVEDRAKEADVRARAEGVLKQIQAGADFAELAKKFSEDTGSAEQGGYLGPFARGRMVREFEDAAFALKPGEVSGLVRTQFGYHIIKVLHHEVPSLEDARPGITRSVQLDRATDLVRRKATEAAKLAETDKDLNSIAKSLGVPAEVRETGLLASNADPQASGITQSMLDEIFRLKAINDVGKAVDHPLGQAVPKLLETRLPKPPDFNESRAAVERDLIDDRSGALMQAEAKKLTEEAGKSAGLAAAAKRRGFAVQTSKSFKRTGASDPDIAASQQAIAASFDLAVGSVSAPISVDNGRKILVLQVKSRTPFDEEAFKKQRAELRERMLGMRRDSYFRDYIRRVTDDLEKAGKIRINSRAIDEVTGVRT